jgi:hypothetical protein
MTSPAAAPGAGNGRLPAAGLRDDGAAATAGRPLPALATRRIPGPQAASGMRGPRPAPVDPPLLARVKAALERL